MCKNADTSRFEPNTTYQDLLEQRMTGNLRYTLMNDFLSKYSLQKDHYALQGLLSALLHVRPETITKIEILNPIEPGYVVNDKNCILDVKLELNGNQIINIEIQSRRQDFWPERSVTYLCRNFDHLKEGAGYHQTKTCIQIGILDHDLFRPDDPRYTDEFFVEYELLSKTRHTGYTGKFQIKVLVLSHLEDADEQEKNEPNGLYYWAKLFKAQSWEELRMIAKNNPRMESFIGTVKQLTAEEQVAQACEARRRYTQDIATYEEEIEGLQSVRNQLSEERDRLSKDRDRLSEDNDRLSQDRDRLYEELSQKAEIERQMQVEIASLKEKLEALQNSQNASGTHSHD